MNSSSTLLQERICKVVLMIASLKTKCTTPSESLTLCLSAWFTTAAIGPNAPILIGEKIITQFLEMYLIIVNQLSREIWFWYILHCLPSPGKHFTYKCSRNLYCMYEWENKSMEPSDCARHLEIHFCLQWTIQ